MAKRKMKIIMANNIGFCFGVERAYKISLESLKNGECQMLGHLVHNEKVVEGLKVKGLKFIPDLNKLQKGKVIIRAHGVGDKTIKALKEMEMEIIDATCPLVKKAQDFARSLDKDGRKVIIIGEKGHAEVKAINGSVGDRAIIIENKKDINSISKELSLGIVVQTTKDSKLAGDIINTLRKRFNDIKVCDTLCHAVLKRQEEVKKMAKKVDVILVVGSKTSANTQTLVQVAQRIQTTYGIQGPEELKKEWFIKITSVGIISGTSTPYWLIKLVEDKLRLITL